MKLKDIEVGKEYADTYGDKVLVLEVGVYGKVYPDSRWVSTVRSNRKDYVRVESNYERLLHCRTIKHDWETQERINKAQGEIKDDKRAEVSRLWDILEKHIPGIEREMYRDTDIGLNRTNVNRVCEALERLEETKVPD